MAVVGGAIGGAFGTRVRCNSRRVSIAAWIAASSSASVTIDTPYKHFPMPIPVKDPNFALGYQRAQCAACRHELGGRRASAMPRSEDVPPSVGDSSEVVRGQQVAASEHLKN